MIETSGIYFIHNSINSFYESMKIFFLESFYPRYKFGTVTTYDKNLQTILQSKETNNIQHFRPPTPSFSIDPNLDISQMDQFNYLWRYRNLAGGFGGKLYEPIYKDDYVKITPVYNRFEGTFEVKSFLSSPYEVIDLKMRYDQFFGSKNRIFRPSFVRTYLHIPLNVVNYIYENDVLDIKRGLDWSNTDLKYTIYKSLGKEEFMIPLTLTPWISLESTNTEIDKYTDNSSYPNNNLNASFKFEITIPTFVVIETDWKVEDIHCNLYVGGDYFPLDATDIIEHHCTPLQCEDGVYSHIENYTANIDVSHDIVDLNRIIQPYEKLRIFKYGRLMYENEDYIIEQNRYVRFLGLSDFSVYVIIQLWRKDGY